MGVQPLQIFLISPATKILKFSLSFVFISLYGKILFSKFLVIMKFLFCNQGFDEMWVASLVPILMAMQRQ